MNATRINNESSGILIDQLVANELCESKRTELIQWLEGSRERWRDLGLAFLEAQTWSSSIAELEAPTLIPMPKPMPLEKDNNASKSLKKLGVGCVLAASLLLTFFGGVKWAQNTSDSYSDHRLARILASDQTPSPEEIGANSRNGSGGIEKMNVTATSNRTAIRSIVSSEKIKRSLEDRGFIVKTEQRYLPATLSDGRQVMLPFDQMTASYVGKTVF